MTPRRSLSKTPPPKTQQPVQPSAELTPPPPRSGWLLFLREFKGPGTAAEAWNADAEMRQRFSERAKAMNSGRAAAPPAGPNTRANGGVPVCLERVGLMSVGQMCLERVGLCSASAFVFCLPQASGRTNIDAPATGKGHAASCALDQPAGRGRLQRGAAQSVAHHVGHGEEGVCRGHQGRARPVTAQTFTRCGAARRRVGAGREQETGMILCRAGTRAAEWWRNGGGVAASWRLSAGGVLARDGDGM